MGTHGILEGTQRPGASLSSSAWTNGCSLSLSLLQRGSTTMDQKGVDEVNVVLKKGTPRARPRALASVCARACLRRAHADQPTAGAAYPPAHPRPLRCNSAQRQRHAPACASLVRFRCASRAPSAGCFVAYRIAGAHARARTHMPGHKTRTGRAGSQKEKAWKPGFLTILDHRTLLLPENSYR